VRELSSERAGYILAAYCLLFGLKPATFWFTKVCRATLKFFRKLLIAVSNYIDDYIFAEHTDSIEALIQFVLQIFKNLGLEINDKSVLEGQWILLYLGVLVDGEQRRFWVPKEKIARIGALLMKLFQQRTDCGRVTLGLLRSVTGYCVSVKLAAPEIMLYLRPLFTVMAAAEREHGNVDRAAPGDTLVRLPEAVLADLRQIPAAISLFDGARFYDPEEDGVQYFDAGNCGAGEWHAQEDGSISTWQRYLPEELIGKSSTARELWAPLQFYKEQGTRFKGMTQIGMFDSINTVKNIQKRGRNLT
jgi:hypothetical protein